MHLTQTTFTKIVIVEFGILLALTGCGSALNEVLDQLPEYNPYNDIPNREWTNEELITIQGYTGDAMEAGISPDGNYLLFNDRNKPNKDMHWSTRIDDRTYQYRGKVENTVSNQVDGTPSFDGQGNLYFTTLKNYAQTFKSVYVAKFDHGIARNPVPVAGNIYVENPRQAGKTWISLDPDISDDGTLLFYSEGRFYPQLGFPYPFNVRGARRVNGEFVKLEDRILENINTHNLEYAPTISSNGLEIFFSRIGKVDGRLAMVGIFTARRQSTEQPFSKPEKIMAITGEVEAPVLSGDETMLYYHRMDRGVFKIYRVTRKQAP